MSAKNSLHTIKKKKSKLRVIISLLQVILGNLVFIIIGLMISFSSSYKILNNTNIVNNTEIQNNTKEHVVVNLEEKKIKEVEKEMKFVLLITKLVNF